jgi:hypothetical protein
MSLSERVAKFSLAGLLVVFVLGCPLWADTIVGSPGDPGVGDCIPFGCIAPGSSNGVEYQEIFDSSLFSGPITIAGLTFFLNNFDNADPITGEPIVPDTIYPADYTILFSVVSIPVDGLDPTVENNIDPSTAQIFYVGSLSNMVSGQFTIQTTPANYFFYDPSQGNLLMDITNDGTDQFSQTVYLDINSSSGGLFSSAYDSDPPPCVTTGCTEPDYGLVVGFETPADLTPVPEPATIWLILSMTGVLALRGMRRAR